MAIRAVRGRHYYGAGYSFGFQFPFCYVGDPDSTGFWIVYHGITGKVYGEGLTEDEAHRKAYQMNGSPAITLPD